MPSRFQEFRKDLKETLSSEPHIRNRALAVGVLLLLLAVLVLFSLQQGFPGLEQSGSQLLIFVAININIVLLAIVFYLIARNLLKLAYERRRHILGVNLKTKLITAFITLSLPAMGFHLFASFFIAANLETWLKGRQDSMLHSAQNVESLVRGYYLVIFLLMTLFIIFVATWLAFYLARGFVQPIEDLALATQRVAEGELGYQVELSGPLDKDFALLMESFNMMSYDLREHRTALEKTTEHLRESHQTLESHIRFVELVLENITTGVISLDMEGNVESLNRSAKQMLQLQTTQFIGRHYRNVLEKESLEMFEEMVEHLETGEEHSVSRNLTVHKQAGTSGANSPVQISAALLLLQNREGQAAGMVCVYNNITEIQRLQRARAWREVARRIAHEIKNPLTPIQLSAERIQRKYTAEVADNVALRQSTQTIINEVHHLKRMVNEFSNFAKIPESNPQLDDLNRIVLQTLQLYQDNMPNRIVLATELSKTLPQLPLDGEQIRRVVINLLDNAISSIDRKGKLSRIFRQGEIIVRTRHVPDLNIVCLDVQDNGTGISPEISDQLFEPYTTTKEQGTGLGLTIVSQTVSDHNGFIRIRNLDSAGNSGGGGVCFSIELPVT